LGQEVLLSGWEITGIVSQGQPFNLRDSRVADRDLADNTRPRVTGSLPGALATAQLSPTLAHPMLF
jgi:hypothetical protein